MVRSLFFATRVAVVGIAIAQSACATIVHGKTQSVPITSNPPGARVSIDGVAVGRTPVDVRLARGQSHLVSVAQDTGAPIDVTLARNVSPWVYGNLFTWLVPALLDFNNGAAYHLDPDLVHVAFSGFRPGWGLPPGSRIRVLTAASPDGFVHAIVDSVTADQLFVRRSANADSPPSSVPEAIAIADVRRLDVSHAAERGVRGQLGMRLLSQITLGSGVLLAGSAIGGLFLGGLYNIAAIPVGFAVGYATAGPRWSPREADRSGSPLAVDDRLRVRFVDSTRPRISGRLVDIDGPDLLIAASKDTLRVPRVSILSVGRAKGINFKKAALIALGLGAVLGAVEVGTRDVAQPRSEWSFVPVAGAFLALYSMPAFAPRRWAAVLKW